MNLRQLRAQFAQIEGIIFDVDGVLTNGQIIYTDDGHELKQFHVQDGASIKLLMEHGVDVALITGRRSPVVARRARELGITHLAQGASSKVAALAGLIDDGFTATNLAAVGDDIQDLALFEDAAITMSITVPNAHPAVLARADWTTQRRGGDGVVVDIAEQILKARGQWAW